VEQAWGFQKGLFRRAHRLVGAQAHVGDRCACSRMDQASSPVREGSEGQEMGWPRGHCQAGLLSRGQLSSSACVREQAPGWNPLTGAVSV